MATARAGEPDSYGVLAREHRLIERVLAVLGRISDETRRTRRLNGPAGDLVLLFLRDFADRVHHSKEERILFPAIAAHGHFPGCGLIAEHEDGRERLRRMAGAAQGARNGNEEAVRLFVRTARSYVSFLRDHIAKEDECLADVVDATFTRDEHERLLEEFDEIERREVGARVFERFVAMVQELEIRYPPPPSSEGTAP